MTRIWRGTAGSDSITGWRNDNNLFTNFGQGIDNLTGGDRSDVFALTVDDRHDRIDGGSGIDTVDYSEADRGLIVDLHNGLAIAKFNTEVHTPGGAVSRIEDKIVTDLRSIENVIGSDHDDIIVGSAGRNVIEGGGGADTIHGGGGSDTFVFSATSGHDTVADFQAGGPYHDVLEFEDVFSGFEDFLAHAGNDGAGVVIRIDDHNSVTLLNTQISDLSSSDFCFS